MLNLNQLRAFYQTAKHLSFTAAAKRLFITQPAVTAQVKLLEEALELKLFKKRGGRIHLTEEGRILYEYAQRIFHCESELEDAIEKMKQLRRGVLRIGTARTYARHFMPGLISRFRDSHPHIKIELSEGSSLDMMQGLMDLKNELAVVARIREDPSVQFILLSQEEVVPILSPRHSLAGRTRVSFEQIARDPVIMKESGSGTRRLVDELYSRHGIQPRILMESSDAEVIKLLVQHGDGISFLVRMAVARELQKGLLASVALSGESLFLEVNLAYLKDQPLSPPAQAFVENLEILN